MSSSKIREAPTSPSSAGRGVVTLPGCLACIDVSASNVVTDWAAVAASGVQAVYVEHGLGNDGGNACAAAQVTGARAAGLRVGRYSFLYPIGLPGAGRTAEQQAALHAALDYGPYGLPDAMDLEWPEPPQFARWGCSPSQIVQWVLDYAAARAVPLMLYTFPAFVAELGSPAALARFPLWLAEWDVEAPTVPAPWGAWAGWQHTSKGTVTGIEGPVDLSWLCSSELPTQPDPIDSAPSSPV